MHMQTKRFADMTCADFSAVLASGSPTPGGGGAAAIAGALGVALANMVGSLAEGKEKYAEVAGELASLGERAGELRTRLLELADEDARAFEPLSRAYAMPTTTEGERAAKQVEKERCLARAAEPPLAIMEAAGEGIEICARYAEIGPVLAVSDAGCGAALCLSALEAGFLNVAVNTKGMADRPRADEIDSRARELLDAGRERAGEVLEYVCGRLS